MPIDSEVEAPATPQAEPTTITTKPSEPCIQQSAEQTEVYIPDSGLGRVLADKMKTEGWEPIAKPKDSNERYNYLIAAAKHCFDGTVYEAWAKADHCVRTKFRGSQREQCNQLTAELEADQQTEPSVPESVATEQPTTAEEGGVL